jgi:hypothetical protein
MRERVSRVPHTLPGFANLFWRQELNIVARQGTPHAYPPANRPG